MISFLLKTAGKSLRRNRLFSLINISGLAVAIACCVLIGLFTGDELSFDRQNTDADRIYRIVTDFSNTDGSIVPTATTPPEIANHIKAAIPEVESVTRLFVLGGQRAYFIRAGKNQFLEEKLVHTDSSFFDLFTAKFLQGSPGGALNAPWTVVLTESAAKKYFGTHNAMGQTIQIDDWEPCRVTAVVKDPPATAHFAYTMLVHRDTDVENPNSNWDWSAFHTYIKVRPHSDMAAVDRKIRELVARNSLRKGRNFYTQPLTSIHLESNRPNELSANSDRAYLYILAAIGLLILFIACVNYINLSTAQSALRAKEIGIRKVNGAGLGMLRKQFLTETLLTSLLATVLGVLGVALLLPAMNEMTGKTLSLWPDHRPFLLLIVLGFGLLIGLITGLYPAVYLSSFRPAIVLKGSAVSGRSGTLLRKSLVVTQFALAIALMIGTFVLRQQVKYAQDVRLGLNKDNVVLVQFPYTIPEEETGFLKESMGRVPGVISVSVTNGSIPGRTWDDLMRYRPTTERHMIHSIGIDTDYLSCMNIPLLEGRNFFGEKRDPDNPEIIFNERAIKQLGIPAPVQGRKVLTGTNPKTGRMTYSTIVGVVKDFHFSSMKNEIEPFAFFRTGIVRSDMSVRIEGSHTGATLSAMEKVWTSQVHSWPFAFQFLSADFARLYDSEERFSRLFAMGCVIAIFVSCLGLFGLSTFMIGQRRKEIGVRKVLGGSVIGIAGKLAGDFTRLVIVAAFIAFPVAGFFMQRWLNGYAYRTTMHWWTFLIALLASLTIALLTVGFQAVRAARANPIKSLRAE